MFNHHVVAGDLDLDSSPVLIDGGELVGFSYLGRRGDRGWIGGFGVAPAHRGRGVGREIFAEQMAVIRRLGLARVQLEVLRQNWAKKLYARGGIALGVTETLAQHEMQHEMMWTADGA